MNLRRLVLVLLLALSAAAQEPPRPDLLEKAKAELRRGDRKAALATLGELLETSPSAAGYFHRGHLRLDLGDAKGAVADLSESLRLDPRQPTALLKRGEAYALFLDEPARGLEDLSRAIELDPSYGAGFVYRGRVRLLLGDVEGFLQDHARGQDLIPSYPYGALWVAAAGGPRDALAKSAQGQTWPAPIARFLLGTSSANELRLAAKQAQSESARSEHTSEAEFFIALQAEYSGDLAQARAGYKRVAEAKTPRLTETRWARARLRRMKAD